jgi:hypothetical protein
VRPCAEESADGLSTGVTVAIRCGEFTGGGEMKRVVFELGWGREVDCEFYPLTEAGAVDCRGCSCRSRGHVNPRIKVGRS